MVEIRSRDRVAGETHDRISEIIALEWANPRLDLVASAATRKHDRRQHAEADNGFECIHVHFLMHFCGRFMIAGILIHGRLVRVKTVRSKEDRQPTAELDIVFGFHLAEQV